MTVLSRNRILQSLSFFSLILNTVFLYRLFINLSDIVRIYESGSVHIQKWWFLYSRNVDINWKLSLGLVLGISLLSLLINFVLNFFFRKTSSQEMFYFRMFLLTLSLYSIRCLHFFIQLNHFGLYYHVLITRVLYFLRLMGMGCLFLSGIAIYEKKFQRMSTIFLAVLLASSIIAVIIPVNQDFYLGSLINPLTDELTFFMFFLVLQFLVLLNYLLYVYYRSSWDNLGMLIGVLMILLCSDFFFYINTAGMISSLLCLPLASYLFSRKIFFLYLWR